MALNPAALKASFLALFNTCRVAPGLNEDQFADQMSTIIDAYIKTATVSVTTAGVQGGGSTLPGTGSLS